MAIITCIILFLLQESYQYKDPITEFIECLYVNFDFDGAQKKLRECESVSIEQLVFICNLIIPSEFFT